jgi:hypothetical protein
VKFLFQILLLAAATFCQPSLAQTSADFWQQPLELLPQSPDYLPGSFRFADYDSLIKDKRIALVVNHTAEFRGTHLVDTLLKRGVKIVKIFAPEHGFRGTAAAGETILNGLDARTRLPLLSLYGKTKKPTPDMLSDVDLVLFDIQDVGARFYTYISTMKLVMEACAEQGKVFLVCDRANPLGFCFGGPVLKPKYISFVGAFPIPVVHGLTVAELARMAQARRWFKKAGELKLHHVKCAGYRHSDTIFPALPPSPNLRTPLAILAYPSLCLFEGTSWSVGRGTDFPFECYGYPDSLAGEFRFRPAEKQLHGGKQCFGMRITPDMLKDCFSLQFLLDARRKRPADSSFLNPFFNRLAGGKALASCIRNNKEFKDELRSWEKLRQSFLLYP